MSTRGRERGGRGMTPQGVTTTSLLTPAMQSTPNNPKHNSSAAPQISESVQASESLTSEDAPVTRGHGRTKGLALVKEKFDLPETPYVNKVILRAMGKQYCDSRSHLKKKFEKGIVNCPEHIEEADWTYLCNLWQDTVYVSKSKASIFEKVKKRMVYLGDGRGDFCPSLKLGKGDHVMPR
ncbi:hypothetical protein Vadar_005043 [Vaccinium darrowii]|uniref:Uncharacterized protein n=1 Tax=Vaccinium darrowii TaxID=229202 RepID=A0ACB7XNB6_9ERIC|nr:hypothetical protein Vadar_005043 [Vaccinium darrowii]